MSQSARSEARLKIRSQLVKRQEGLLAREARIPTEALEAAAAIVKRDRAVLEADTQLGQALAKLTSKEGLPVDGAAGLCGLEAREVRRLIQANGRARTKADSGVSPASRRTGEVER